MEKALSSLDTAAKLIQDFGADAVLTARIADLENAGVGLNPRQIEKLLEQEDVGTDLVAAAATIKALAGQVNVLMHAAGILVSLPHILEPGEVVESLSLGAGNTGRDHDLETDRRIAEFKFLEWRPSRNTIRENVVFADVFSVAAADTNKRRVVYLLGTDHALRFLRGGRALTSVLSRSPKVRRMFEETYGTGTFATVREYWATVCEKVEIVDLRELVPDVFASRPPSA